MGKASKAKEAQGYVQHRPRCSTCFKFQPAVHGVPSKGRYHVSMCTLGNFACSPTAICDHWDGLKPPKVEGGPS